MIGRRGLLQSLPIIRGAMREQYLSASHQSSTKAVAIIGGGVAGMSAACALAEAGFRVRLVERRSYLGGRANSYLHPGVNEVIDNCQHVLFGCCTNLIGFYRRIGALERIHWSDGMTMIEPGAEGKPGRRRGLFEQGLPLIGKVNRELAVDLDLFSRGGLEILRAIERRDYDVLSARPAISKRTKLGLAMRAVSSKALPFLRLKSESAGKAA